MWILPTRLVEAKANNKAVFKDKVFHSTFSMGSKEEQDRVFITVGKSHEGTTDLGLGNLWSTPLIRLHNRGC